MAHEYDAPKGYLADRAAPQRPNQLMDHERVDVHRHRCAGWVRAPANADPIDREHGVSGR